MHFLAEGDDPPVIMIPEPVDNEDSKGLPQVKIKRNYVCSQCDYFTQNPRSYLMHLRHVHKERMRIYECPHCTYASRHSQKMHRHVSMVHDPERPERRRPGPAPRLREEYYADFVAELNKRREARLQKRRGASSPAFSAAPAAAYTPLPTAPSTSRAPPPDCHRPSDESDDDSDDRLVIDNEPDLETHDEDNYDFPEAVAALEQPSPDHVDGEEEGEEEEAEGPGPGRRGRDIRLEMDPLTRQYKCSSCDFTSKTPSLVARHESVVHLKKRFYRCSKCTYVTHLRARYTKHYKYHTMPLIKCAECDFSTPYKWNLDRHVKNHGGAGKYTCRACSFSSEIRQSLTVHEMNHHQPPVGPPGEVRVPHKKRQNKVGGTELLNKDSHREAGLKQESEMLRMEWEESEYIQVSTWQCSRVQCTRISSYRLAAGGAAIGVPVSARPGPARPAPRHGAVSGC